MIETRVPKTGETIRRRRQCLACDYRFTTRESVVRTEIAVVKRDGVREDFDPEKLRLGIRRACWKRQVSEEQIDRAVAEVAVALERMQLREIPSATVGELVMAALQRLDDVAYVRFASVYRRFKDADQFVREVNNLNEKQDP